jgi:biopolymer transport protein ExbD
MRLPDEQEIPAQVNIVPMIDVTFSLLTFFIMSSLFLTRSQGLPVNLPSASTTQQSRTPQKITVSVDEKGGVSLNREPTSVDNLTEQVRTLVSNNPDALVVINADRKVEHGLIVTIMDRVRKVPGAKLAIATQKS